MMKLSIALVVALALVLSACKSTNDPKPVYFVPPTAAVA